MASEKRLIDANFLVNKMIPNCPIEDGGIPLKDFDTHQKILALYPTVDAVEVVRCKDCKYRTELSFRVGICKCPDVAMLGKYTVTRKENDFCSYGERRTDEN